MNIFEQQLFDFIYKQHLINLKLQGKCPAIINASARVIRCITDFFECSPDSPNYSGQPFPHTFKVEFSNSIGTDHQYSCEADLGINISPHAFSR